MSDEDLARGLRAILSAPHALTDEQVREIHRTMLEEVDRRRVQSRVDRLAGVFGRELAAKLDESNPWDPDTPQFTYQVRSSLKRHKLCNVYVSDDGKVQLVPKCSVFSPSNLLPDTAWAIIQEGSLRYDENPCERCLA